MSYVFAFSFSRSRVLEWVAISCSHGLHFVITFHCDLSIMGGPAHYDSSSTELCKPFYQDKTVFMKGMDFLGPHQPSNSELRKHSQTDITFIPIKHLCNTDITYSYNTCSSITSILRLLHFLKYAHVRAPSVDFSIKITLLHTGVLETTSIHMLSTFPNPPPTIFVQKALGFQRG